MSLPGEKRRLQWDRGSAEVWALSAALHHLEVALPDGRRVRPLAEAPWHDEPATTGDAALAAHLRYLGGDWPCIPFGRSDADPIMHGFGTDNCWEFASANPETLSLAIAYPADRVVAGMTRTIAAIPGEARVDFTVVVEARAACRIPVGLHPILALGKPGERVRLETGFSHGETFPAVFEPKVSRFAVGSRFDSTEALPLDDGSTIAFADLLNRTGEEAFQLFGVDGALRVVYPDSGYAVRLEWNPADFPTCLFWVSTGGRTHNPWNGRFRGFGVEPLHARFGVRDGEAAIGEGRSFLAGERWTTQYSLSVEPL